MRSGLLEKMISDDLSQEDIARITGVSKGSRDRIDKQIRILKSAGIYFWLKIDGDICTTWAHVHNARAPDNPAKSKPNLDLIK